MCQMCPSKLKICLLWIIKLLLFIACSEEIGVTNVTHQDMMIKSASKCHGNPLLTDSSRGQAITMIASSISGMDVLANVDSPQYKAVCWMIHDDLRQLDPMATNSSSVAQRYILAVLYYSTQGSAWYNTYNFLSEKDECEWHEYNSSTDYDYGALCYETGNIYKINLSESNLDGAIPSELSRLTYLEILALHSNNLRGTIPYQLGKIKNLIFLSLDSNKLTGTIPEVELKNIQSLGLNDNMLTGTIPESIYSLELGWLGLDDNMLSGTISSFSSKYLRVLNLGNNNLTGTLPQDFNQSVSLDSIYLYTNKFSGTIPDAVTNLKNLTNLMLMGNDLSGSIPSALFKLPNIRDIFLWNNFLTGPIPNDVHNNSMVRILFLQNNSLTGTIPSQLSKMAYLEELQLNNNNLSGEIPSELSNLEKFDDLTFFYIQNNNVTGTISSCGQRFVEADCNTPKKVSCHCCTQCYGLYTTSEMVSRNKLDCPSSELQIDVDFSKGLGSTTFHRYVLLDNARERIILDEGRTKKSASSHHKCISSSDCFELIIFGYDRNIYQMSVYVDGNLIIPETSVGQDYKSFYFGYSNNSMVLNQCEPYHVCDVTIEPNTEKRKVVNKMIGLLNSTEIDDDSSVKSKVLCDWIKYIENSVSNDQISFNLIQRFVLMLLYHSTQGTQWFNNNQWLSDKSECLWYGVTCNEYGVVIDLDLSSNNLIGFIPSEFGELRGLESLELNDNHIEGVIPQEIEKLEQLKILRMSRNQLEQNIPVQTYKLHSLCELDLSSNALSGSIPNDIGRLKNLENLNFSNNFIADQLPDQIYSLNKMVSLSLSNNLFVGNISRLSELFQLETLQLNNNFFAGNIPINGQLKYLKVIDLSRNRFTGSIHSSIGKMVLTDIFLSHNELTGNIPNEIGNLKASRISISYNRIKGTIPSDIRKLTNLSLLHLHHNQIKGNADYIEIPVKSYITDCGSTFENEALVECMTCSECCTSDGGCLKVQYTWPQQDLKKWDVQPAYALLGITLGVAIALFCTCLILKKIIGERLPRLHVAKSHILKNSAFRFFLVSDAKAWLMAIVAVVIQLYILYVFIRASDFTYGKNDWEYSMSCENNEELCDDSRFISIHGWVIFGIVLSSFLFKDLIDGLFLVYESLTSSGGLKELFAGIVVLFVTSFLFLGSALYNYSTSLSDTGLLKNVAVLLFLSVLDEKLFEIVERVFPSWTEQIQKRILQPKEEIDEELSVLDDSKNGYSEVPVNVNTFPDLDHSEDDDQDVPANDEESPMIDTTKNSSDQDALRNGQSFARTE